MTKDRIFEVKLVDNNTNKIILSFKGLVSDKKQSSGRFGGDVNEILFVNAWDIDIKGFLKNNVSLIEKRIRKNNVFKKSIKKKIKK